MSWTAYITNMEQGKGKCKYAGIFGKNQPVSVWAESTNKADFPITVDDVTRILKAITSQDMSIMGTGIKIGKLNFTCLIMDVDLLICQGKGDLKDCSLVIALGGQCIIIGYNADPGVKTALVREAVEGIRDYLKSVGY